MKKLWFLLGLFLSVNFIVQAQFANQLPTVDTVTTGEFDDTHPMMYHHHYVLPTSVPGWVVFERRTDSASVIAAKVYSSSTGKWDSSVTIISSSPIDQEQKLPDIAVGEYSVPRIVAVWQKKENNVWNILFSFAARDSLKWIQPIRLTFDTVNCTDSRVVSYMDSSFIVTWKERNAVLYTVISPSAASTVDTLIVSNEDSLEYDIASEYNQAQIVVTAADTMGQRMLVTRRFDTQPKIQLSPPETLSARGALSNPRLPFSWGGPVIYELSSNGRHDVRIVDRISDTSLSNDSTADFRNARAFFGPKVTATPRGQSERSAYWFDVLTMDEIVKGDSLLLFQQYLVGADTVRSKGYNRNACIGSCLVSVPQYRTLGVPVVWESNRDGRSHIYSRMALIWLGSVKDNVSNLNTFELLQNFPNPFNPSTTIRFRLSAAAHVTLTIFDLTGRTVETVIDKRMDAGNYSAIWDGRNVSSGVYFCRLRAGSLMQTRKLILVK